MSPWLNCHVAFLFFIKQFFLCRVLGLFRGCFLHFSTSDPGVGRRATKNEHVTGPPEHGFTGAVEHHGDDGLRAGLRRPRHVVRERAGVFDLKACDVTDGETEHASERHHGPEPQVGEEAEVNEATQVPENKEERQEQDGGIDVVVVRQSPDVVFHCWHHLLCEDGIQRDKSAGQNPKKDPSPGEGPSETFLIHAQPESTWQQRVYLKKCCTNQENTLDLVISETITWTNQTSSFYF